MGDINSKSNCNLDEKQLATYLEKVNSRIAEIVEILSEEDTLATDSGSNGFEEMEIEISQNKEVDERRSKYIPRLQKEEELLKKARQALKSGNFSNICQNCGNYISFERLIFAPETKYCQCFGR